VEFVVLSRRGKNVSTVHLSKQTPKESQQSKKRNRPKDLVVIGAFETPLHGPSGTSLPVLYSATSENGEGGSISTNEAHALGLNNSIDDDRIPNSNG